MDDNGKRDLILHGNMARVILTLAGPIMLGNFIQTMYNLADTYFVSQIGDTQVAAITLIWPIIFLMMSIGMGVGIAGTALISQYVGSHQMKEANEIAGQMISFSFIFSVGVAVVGAFATPAIVRAMGGTGELLSEAVAYLRIIFIGMPTMFLFFSYMAIKQGQGDTVTPMKLSGISAIANIVLDPLFIFGFGWGIQGAAYATVLSRGTLAIYAMYKLSKDTAGISLRKKYLILNKPALKHLLVVALPSSIGRSTEAFGFTILTMFIMSFGEVTVAAFGIGNRINSLILMPAMGIGNALATVVGQNLGADNVSRAKGAVRTSTILATVFLALGGTLMFNISESIIAQFTDSPEVLVQGTYFMKLLSATLPLMGFFQIFVGTFQGSGHTFLAMILMSGRLWVLRIPMIALFGYYTNLAERSVWYAMIISNGLICIVGLGIYLTGTWQKKVIKSKNPTSTVLLKENT